MDFETIRNWNDDGAWFTNWWFYYAGAYRILNRAIEQDQAIQQKRQEIIDSDPEYGESFADYELEEERSDLSIQVSMVEVLSCMSIESFLNYYGVRYLGEEFYKHNIERVGATEKLDILIALSSNKLLPKGSDISKCVRRMFDRRNQLVHPKTNEASIERLLRIKEDPLKMAIQSVEDTQLFFDAFFSLDENLIGEEQYYKKITKNKGRIKE